MTVIANAPARGGLSQKRRPLKRSKETSSLTDQAYELLRRDILSCVLQPGSDISEADIADRLRISKTPVREALARLRIEGFVKAFPRRGYQILPLTISDMDELFDLRGIVEAGCGELAAERISDSELDRLEELADASYDLETTANLDRFISANRDFHLAIASASNNRRLQDLVFKLLDELERFFYHGARARDVNTEVQSDHHRIVEVLRGRDRQAARQIMTAHNEATRRGLFEAISQSGRRRAKMVIS